MKLSPNSRPFLYSIGQRGEVAACEALIKSGYKILEKNYRCKLGEIDIVAEHKGRIVFIEVKTRTSEKFGTPEEAVHPKKQEKLLCLASWYLKAKKLEAFPVSLAVVAVFWKEGKAPQIRIISNAFEKNDKDA